MILVADSGSTKATWGLIQKDGKILTCNTSGINPFFLKKNEIIRILETEFSLDKEGVTSVFFYGAGCIPSKTPVLFEALTGYFDTEQVEIHSDLLAAARSLCQDQPGIACVLGTGSNSCYYDGREIILNVPPLGFILGDEGSGAALGKRLIGDILKNQLSREIIDDFFASYSVTVPEILEHVYRKPFPNRFLAQYTRFIARHIDKKEIASLVNGCFREFIQRNLLQYKEVKALPVHFTGSIAFHFSENLENVIREAGLRLGSVSQAPMDGLIKYHLYICGK